MNNPKSGIGQVTDLAQAACRSQTQPRIYGTGRSARCSESDILQDALVQCEKKIRINSVGVCRFESGSPEYVCVCTYCLDSGFDLLQASYSWHFITSFQSLQRAHETSWCTAASLLWSDLLEEATIASTTKPMVTLKTTTNIVLRTHLKWTCCLSSLPILLCSYTRTSPFIKDVYKYSVTPSFAWDWPCRRHLSFAVDNSAKLPEVQLEDRSRNKSNLKPWIQHSFPFDESKRYETHEVSKIKFLTLQEHRPSTTKLEKEGTQTKCCGGAIAQNGLKCGYVENSVEVHQLEQNDGWAKFIRITQVAQMPRFRQAKKQAKFNIKNCEAAEFNLCPKKDRWVDKMKPDRQKKCILTLLMERSVLKRCCWKML